LSIKDVLQLSKIRLTISVVFSAIAGYFIAGGTLYSFSLIALLLGGGLVVAASNGLNQVLEKDLDKLMRRTKNRPLPKKRMSVNQAVFLSVFMAFIGVVLLFAINIYCGAFGLLSVLFYVLAYTPLKRVSSISVFVGAFPGAIPFMLGWISVSNRFSIESVILFAIQFIWQFPHFWAIAWVSNEDYLRAGFKMLPGQKDKATAFKALIYILFLIPLSVLPFFSFTGDLKLSLLAALLAAILGLWFLTKSLILFRTLNDTDAKKLMYSSIIYLPMLQLIYIIDKLL